MSNGNTQWESAPASNGVTRAASPADNLGSVVGRALSVLREHGARAPAGHPSGGWAPDPSAAPGIGELHKQLERLRDQAQDLVDELVRIIESIAAGAATGTNLADAQPGHAPPAPPVPLDLATTSLPNLAQLRRVTAVAGQATSTRFSLVNDMHHPVEVLMKASSLIGPQGFELPSRSVGFAPNPLLLAASAAQPVDITIRVPEQVPPGQYSGLVQGVGLDGASAQLTVEVRPASDTG